MTALRRQRTKLLTGPGPWLVVVMVCLILASPGPGAASTTERVVTDPLTGLAINGFDPVAYFTDGAARPGSADLEYRAGGVIWRFRNEGNRAAFAAAPHIYRPRFGGYDPVAVARGVGTAGHPDIWMISGNQLYLFYNVQARAAFAADPLGIARNADQRWPEVLLTLAP